MHTLKKAENHEEMCWGNPANRTCKSCLYERYGWEGDGEYERAIRIRECLHPQGCKIDEVVYEKLTLLSGHIKPLPNCPFWTARLKNDNLHE